MKTNETEKTITLSNGTVVATEDFNKVIGRNNLYININITGCKDRVMKDLLFAIEHLSNVNNTTVSHQFLAKQVNASVATVKRKLNTLKDLKLITWVSGKNKKENNTYSINTSVYNELKYRLNSFNKMVDRLEYINNYFNQKSTKSLMKSSTKEYDKGGEAPIENDDATALDTTNEEVKKMVKHMLVQQSAPTNEIKIYNEPAIINTNAESSINNIVMLEEEVEQKIINMKEQMINNFNCTSAKNEELNVYTGLDELKDISKDDYNRTISYILNKKFTPAQIQESIDSKLAAEKERVSALKKEATNLATVEIPTEYATIDMLADDYHKKQFPNKNLVKNEYGLYVDKKTLNEDNEFGELVEEWNRPSAVNYY